MTTKELIDQYVTAHADNRWMDASELEASDDMDRLCEFICKEYVNLDKE